MEKPICPTRDEIWTKLWANKLKSLSELEIIVERLKLPKLSRKDRQPECIKEIESGV